MLRESGKSRLRYNAFSSYLRKRYGGRIQKVPLDAGFGCPHRSGKGHRQGEGCIYCSNAAFSPQARTGSLPLHEQLALGIQHGKKRYRALGFIAYFQAYSNTFGPLNLLKERYDVVRQFPNIVGLSVGTRPDCVDGPVLDLLESYSEDYEVWVEYGLQSGHDKTLSRILRGHSVEDFLRSVERTARRKVLICVHVILGLPGESRNEMMETARLLAGLPIQGIKIHHCHVIRDTLLAEEYLQGRYRPMESQEYVSCVCDFLERIPWTVTIQRLMGEARKELLLAPDWTQDKPGILQAINKELVKRQSRQGINAPTRLPSGAKAKPNPRTGPKGPGLGSSP